MINKSILYSLPAFLSSPVLLAEALVFDFESENIGDIIDDNEVPGWTQSPGNPPGFFGFEFPLSYIDRDNLVPSGGESGSYFFGDSSTKAVVLGKVRANEQDGLPVTVSTTFDTSSLAPSAPQVMLNLGVLDFATTTAWSAGRASYEIVVTGSGSELALISLEQSLTVGIWDVRVSTNGASLSGGPVGQISRQTGYTFSIDFEPTQTVFSFGSTGDPSTFLAAEPAVSSYANSVDGLSFTHFPTDNEGDSSAIIFDDIMVSVPEPGSSLLLGLASLLMVSGRRRRG